MTRTERTYYLLFGLYTQWGWFMAPVYPLFLLGLGLDLFQMNVVLAIYLTSVFLFEVPTGAVADLFGRKPSFLLSCAVRTCAFALYARADSFADCVVAEVLDALGSTLASGALDAWAIDGMRAEGGRMPTDRFFARAQTLSRIVMVVGGVCSGYLAMISFRVNWSVAAAGFAVTGFLAAYLMEEAPRARTASATVRGAYWETVRAGVAIVAASRELRILCVLSFAIVFAAVPTHMTWPARLREIAGGEVWVLGWVWAFINGTAMLGSYVLPQLLMRFRREHVLVFSALWRGATLLVAALSGSFVPVVIGVLLQEAAFGLSEPIFLSWINDRIGPEQRATIISVRSMFVTLGGAVGLLCLGLVARGYGIPLAWALSATLLLLTAPWFLLLGSRALALAALDNVRRAD